MPIFKVTVQEEVLTEYYLEVKAKDEQAAAVLAGKRWQGGDLEKHKPQEIQSQTAEIMVYTNGVLSGRFDCDGEDLGAV